MKKNLTDYFIELITIDSESKNKKQVAMHLKNDLAGSGMENVHTVKEYILLESLKTGSEWVKAVIREYSGS